MSTAALCAAVVKNVMRMDGLFCNSENCYSGHLTLVEPIRQGNLPLLSHLYPLQSPGHSFRKVELKIFSWRSIFPNALALR